MEDGEKRFDKLSIEEHGKFDEETLVNVNNIKKQSTSSQRASGFSNEYLVITTLVATEGVHNLLAINGSVDLKEALQKLGSIPFSRIPAVEVFWTLKMKMILYQSGNYSKIICFCGLYKSICKLIAPSYDG